MSSIVVTSITIEELRALAVEMEWIKLPARNGEQAWQPQAMDAMIAWRILDPYYGVLRVEGPDTEVVMDDLDAVLNLHDDVDVMNAIAAATTAAEVELWATRLGAFAEGDEVLSGTLDVLLGLLASERFGFVAAAVRGLSHARWSTCAEPLRQVGERWPELEADCGKALGSIRRNPA